MTQKHLTEFIARGRRVVEEGLTKCSSGNLSWKIEDKILLSGTGSWIGELSEEEIAIYDLNSGKVVNNIKPTIEKMFHIELLKNRPELNTVLHFQSPFATTIACLKEKPTDFNVTLEIPIYI